MLLFILFCFLPLCSALGAAEVSSETPAQAMASFHQEAAISGLGNVTVGTALEEPVVPPAPAELDEKDPHLVILSRRPDGGIGDYILFADDVTVLREKAGYRAKAAGVSAVGDVELARWEITGPDAGLLPGADVCFVPSDGSYPMLGTVESVQGTAITMKEPRIPSNRKSSGGSTTKSRVSALTRTAISVIRKRIFPIWMRLIFI